MLSYPIVIGPDALTDLSSWLQEQNFSQIIVLTDQHTQQACYPRLQPHLPEHSVMTIQAGERYKTLDTCQHLWQEMTDRALDRKALMINLGGGVIGDMGGFVASTYKRGMAFVQIPTTLLSQVDASVGGKLGIDFMGFKNHIGLYGDPLGVYIDPGFLETLPYDELRSGYAEIIKHHLIADDEAWHVLFSHKDIKALPFPELIRHSVEIKSHIVQIDPKEQGLRKALNFGHTIGHALETARLDTEAHLLHGEAIAVGMIAEAFIAYQRELISQAELVEIETYIREIYEDVDIDPSEFERIFELSRNDKKNYGGQILCTLLDGIGKPAVNQSITRSEIEEALHYYARTKVNS